MFHNGRSLAFIICFSTICTVYYIGFSDSYRWMETQTTVSPPENNAPIILFWTDYFGSDPLPPDYGKNCDCVLTRDKSQLNKADGVVFHPRDMHDVALPTQMHSKQRFIMRFFEVPLYSGYKENLRDMPKDVAARGLKADNLTFKMEDLKFERKRKAVLWFVSNCHTNSKREVAIEGLKEHFPVDILGECGNNTVCQRTDSNPHACDNLYDEYSFFFAAENNICESYVSEKFHSRYKRLSIPIVMRRYIYDGYLPQSFIAMDDFESPAEMAAHLSYLTNNQTAYLEYFAWRKDGWTQVFEGNLWRNLCEKLRNDDGAPKVYADVNSWYLNALKCEDGSFVDSWVPQTFWRSLKKVFLIE